MYTQTNRLTIRNIESADAHLVFPLLHDDGVKLYIPSFYCQTEHQARGMISFPTDDRQSFLLLISNRDTKAPLGFIWAFEHSDSVLSVCISIKANERGKEYCQEAIQALAEFVKSETPYTNLSFMVDRSNDSALRVMEKMDLKIKRLLEPYLIFHLSV